MPKGYGLSSTAAAMPAGRAGIDYEAAPRQQRQGGFLAQHFGPQGSETRYKMAMDMLQSAMSGAQSSGSPALAFLAPLMGAVVGAKATSLRDQYVQDEQATMTDALFGGPLNAQAQQALSVLSNPNAPDYLKQIAATMFKKNAVPVGQMAAPAKQSSGRKSSSRGGSGSTRPQKLTYIMRDPDGVIRGYNAATGKREVVQNADAAPTATPASAPVAPSLPAPPADPTIPRDPSLMNDDEFLNALGVN